MSGEDHAPDLTPGQARTILAAYAGWLRGRDKMIRQAARAGLTATEIAAITGHARTTVTAIIEGRGM